MPDAADSADADPALIKDDPYVSFYDFLVPHAEEVPRLAALAEAAGVDDRAPLVEFGCGSGRLLWPLAARGFRGVGIDRSPAMLARARIRGDALPAEVRARVTLLEGDFRAPPIEPSRYALAVYSKNTLCLLRTADGQQRALEAAARALRPGGRLSLEQFAPPGFFAAAFRQREVYLLATRPNPATGLATAHFMSFAHDPVTQRLAATTILEEFLPGGGSRRHQFVERLRYNHHDELRLRLELAGFEDVRVTADAGGRLPSGKLPGPGDLTWIVTATRRAGIS